MNVERALHSNGGVEVFDQQDFQTVGEYLRRFPKGIISLDIDGALYDQQTGEITDPRIYSTIEQAQRAGYCVSIFSDRPMSYVAQASKEVGAVGPHLAEQGAVIEIPDLSMRFHLDERVSSYVQHLTGSVSQTMELSLAQAGFDNVDVRFFPEAHPIETIGDWPNARKVLHPTAPNIVYIQGSRVSGVGIWVFEDNGVGVANPDLLSAVRETIVSYEAQRPFYRNLEHKLNKSRTFYRAGISITDKSRTWRMLHHFLKDHLRGKKLYHIGDTRADYIKVSAVQSLAVANAEEELLATADRISNGRVTEGVVEHLEWILSQ